MWVCLALITQMEESEELEGLSCGTLVNVWDSQIACDAFEWSLLIGKQFNVSV